MKKAHFVRKMLKYKILSNFRPFFIYIPVMFFDKGIHKSNQWAKLHYEHNLAPSKTILGFNTLKLPQMQWLLLAY